jgi:hypothetical protein
MTQIGSVGAPGFRKFCHINGLEGGILGHLGWTYAFVPAIPAYSPENETFVLRCGQIRETFWHKRQKAISILWPKENPMEDEQNEVSDVNYEIVKDANIERFFNYELQQDEDGFWYDDNENLMGAVVHFESYPTHDTLTATFDDLLVKAVMQTCDVEEDEAHEMIDDCDDEDDFPDEFDISNTFSLLFTVEGHRGLYRTLLDSNDYWTGHSTGRRDDRWDI